MIEVKRISLTRHLILSFVTFNLYNFWWVYKTWSYFQEKEKTDINPALRTIFSTIFLIPLFYKVQKIAVTNKILKLLLSIVLFAVLLFITLLAYPPTPTPYLYLFSIAIFIQPFIAFNQLLDIDEDVTIVEQESFNWKQLVLLVLGGIFWALTLLAIIAKIAGLI